MSNILKNLKKAGKTTLQSTLDQMDSYKSKSQNFKDERYWQPVVDKGGTGSAIIRFLPGVLKEGTEEEYEPTSVRKWSNAFKDPGTGMWYIENNLNTIDQADPMTNYNSKLWNTKDEALMSQARRQKRKLSYISNILVVKHPARPEDEGKVFLYQYGQKIYDKIEEQLSPPKDETDLSAVDVFNLWEGANFRLRIKQVEGFRNYDASTFDAPKPISDDTDELERIFKAEHSLLAEIAPDKFKSFDELQKRMNIVLDIDQDSDKETPPWEDPKSAPKTEAKNTRAAAAKAVEEVVDEDGVVTEKPATTSTSGAAFFKKLRDGKATA